MLKKSLLTVAVLGVFVGVAGAHNEVEKAKDLQNPQTEFVFETAPASCGTQASEVQSEAWFESLLEQQNASRLDEAGVPAVYARRWGGGSWCMVCTYFCYLVRC